MRKVQCSIIFIVALLVLPFCVYAKGYEIVSGDLDTVGSVVKIADEEFYVLGKVDDTHVKLFAKYNLAVGNGYEEDTYRQDEAATSSLNTDYKGGVIFSTDKYWAKEDGFFKEEYSFVPTFETEVVSRRDYASFVYDDNASIKSYVDKYVEYLTSECVDVKGTLISREELLPFGCRDLCYSCYYYSLYCDQSYQWIVYPTYWTGSGYSFYLSNRRLSEPLVLFSFYPMGEDSGDHIGRGTPRDNTDAVGGVRPVIILDTSKQTTCPVEETEKKDEEEIQKTYENPPTGAFVSITLLIILIVCSLLAIIYFKKKSRMKRI